MSAKALRQELTWTVEAQKGGLWLEPGQGGGEEEDKRRWEMCQV